MADIKKKTWPEEFQAVADGKKKFDLRLMDFEVAEGDILILEEWDPKTREYTGRSINKKVTDVRKYKLEKLYWPTHEVLDKGVQIMSLE